MSILAGKLGNEDLASSTLHMCGHIFKALDINEDARISLAELRAYLMSRDAWCKAEAVDALFEGIDRDGNFSISIGELEDAVTACDKPLALWLMSLNPPPAGVPIFADLVRSGGPSTIPLTEERAISLGQLKALLSHIGRRCVVEGWLGKRFENGSMHYARLTFEEINLYDAATHVILPATYGQRLADGGEQPSYIELVAQDGPQLPHYFVSHWWGEPVASFTACIAQHTRDRQYGGGRCDIHGKPGADGDGAHMWVCAYANRQWNLSGALSPDPSETSFHRAILRSRGARLVHACIHTYARTSIPTYR